MSFETNISSRILPREATANEEIKDITDIAAAGFGFEDPTPAVLDDIRNHVESAEIIQIGYCGQERTGFALYRRLLWRLCT